MQLRVRIQLQQLLAHGPPITGLNEEAVLAVLHLQRDAAYLRRDHGLRFVQRFRDFDFEAFADGELQDRVGVREERVEELVVGGEAEDGDGGDEVRGVGFEV
jgi:hypothetical protein